MGGYKKCYNQHTLPYINPNFESVFIKHLDGNSS
jgi:hypothetical protein